MCYNAPELPELVISLPNILLPKPVVSAIRILGSTTAIR